jgi:hypothetical protein
MSDPEGRRSVRRSNPLINRDIVMLGAGALNALDIFFVIHNLNASPNLYGFLNAGMGIGVLAGAILAGMLRAGSGFTAFSGCRYLRSGRCSSYTRE